MVTKRVAARPDFFVEIERGFLDDGDPLVGCALDDFSNLQILPDGRAYRCGLLADQDGHGVADDGRRSIAADPA